MSEYRRIKDTTTFVKDASFDPKKMDDPCIVEAYIPEEYNLKVSGEGLQLANRNELRHPVGVVAARSLRYFSTNSEGFNIFRVRDMVVWRLRHIYNSFNWWTAYVVNAEGERKYMPMLYIGEKFGTPTGNAGEADIVPSAFENDRCIVNQKCGGGAIFAVGYSERGGLFNSPDMYGVKTIVGNKYKGAGVSVIHGITKNLRLMAERSLKASGKDISPQRIYDEIKEMKIVVLDRPRHEKLIKTVRELGAKLILVTDDDLTPTLAVTRNDVDLITGAGGVPEAILSAIIVEKLGGEMSLKILPADIAQDEKLLGKLSNWNLFKKNEIDILRNFKIVRPGTEKEGERSWDTVWTSRDLARGMDMVFTASVIKKTPWIRFPDGKEVPGVELEPETGEVTVHVVRIAGNNLEIVPVMYTTTISECVRRQKERAESHARADGDLLIQSGEAYAEFGMFQRAKGCIRKAKTLKNANKDFLQKCDALYEYIEGLDVLVNERVQTPGTLIEHFKKVCHLGRKDDIWLKSKLMIKRFFEYLGDKHYHDRHYEAALACYREALQYSPQLSLYRKVNSIQMRDMLEEYFHLIDEIYKELNYKESRDLEKYKLGVALEVFYSNEGYLKSSCREPWLIFFRRTVLHGKRPSYKLAILIKLLRLYNTLNTASDDVLSFCLKREFGVTEDEIDCILGYKSAHKKFHSVCELYRVKGLGLECLSKLLLPQTTVESQNELEDADIPLSISLVEVMEKRYKNMLEELKDGYRKEAQEHSYAMAEAYHYVGLALFDVGDDEGVKIYYEKALEKFREIIEKFQGLTPVNAQYRIGNLYEELSLLYENEKGEYCKKAIDAYIRIIDEQQSEKLFGYIRGLVSVRIEQAKERVECLKRELSAMALNI
ncbi:fructose-bisphosphatase class II [Candidatus Brocadia sp. AMX2]|uniref:fructose-bisphosphatase n=1 Tax=Candidatus Brocadia sinica JPN1 TaxID=1197129 RepID=A0ABQ0JSQ1_9BACT|nr:MULTISPECIES: fructose-bisphosphatase class II [Brocadia]MBC6933667.1 fructose-bisphosphatase class II [Candidatus Brocadia sp.]MBL1170497.1 fructose-bisphosphatase class II [Candidatus Brocadia sp. AMX1]MCK6469898.1 fructose-bisphosphatase class II [Candidatus Brocadia sinica]NOG43335.1 fructose-bisphosphatase class II [Planctomycetota bacterium]MDL1936931.1 fructose-bisphosphatase class II [Candidatus Brocadia sp. AMX2]